MRALFSGMALAFTATLLALYGQTPEAVIKGTVSDPIRKAPIAGVKVEIRGQIPPLTEMLGGLAVGLGMAVAVVFLLFVLPFQNERVKSVETGNIFDRRL